MFENLVAGSMSKLLEKTMLGAIGDKVVDDSQSINIPVAVTEDGEASIINVDAPSEFTPNVLFGIDISVKNIGENDTIFVRLINSDTGGIVSESSATVGSGSTKLFTFNIILTQSTSFHGRIEAGHVK